MNSPSYLLTSSREDSLDVYSVENNKTPTILIFECRDDAERYVIMLEQDDENIVGESLHLDITEVELSDAVDIFTEKNQMYILVRKDDLFIPPHYN